MRVEIRRRGGTVAVSVGVVTPQSFLPCTQCSSICSAVARSSSEALAKARRLSEIGLVASNSRDVVRLARSEMMEVLRADYIKFARARGIPERTIRYMHALRNALLPVVTVAPVGDGRLP